MRHEQHLLSHDESRAVIDEVNAWCLRTGTNYNKLVIVAGVNRATRGWVRSARSRLTELTAAKLREAMDANPNGIPREEYKIVPKPWGGPFNMTPIPEPAPPPVDRSACIRCGTRMDLHLGPGCPVF